MGTETFAANPIGIQVDPDLIAAAREAGNPAGQIHARAYRGEFDPGTELDLRMPPPAA
jgi:hypothetical protein